MSKIDKTLIYVVKFNDCGDICYRSFWYDIVDPSDTFEGESVMAEWIVTHLSLCPDCGGNTELTNIIKNNKNFIMLESGRIISCNYCGWRPDLNNSYKSKSFIE